jgi:hypothetical protein
VENLSGRPYYWVSQLSPLLIYGKYCDDLSGALSGFQKCATNIPSAALPVAVLRAVPQTTLRKPVAIW